MSYHNRLLWLSSHLLCRLATRTAAWRHLGISAVRFGEIHAVPTRASSTRAGPCCRWRRGLPTPAPPARVERAVGEDQREQRHQKRENDRDPVQGHLPSISAVVPYQVAGSLRTAASRHLAGLNATTDMDAPGRTLPRTHDAPWLHPLVIHRLEHGGHPAQAIPAGCASSSSGAEDHRREEHHDVTERQAHGSQPV
jgi:hypothetical protein